MGTWRLSKRCCRTSRARRWISSRSAAMSPPDLCRWRLCTSCARCPTRRSFVATRTDLWSRDSTAPQKPKLQGPGADWCAAQLSREDRDFLATFAETISIEVDGLGRVLFCHGSPRSDEEIMTARTPESRLREFLADVEAEVVVCGHTHMQFDRMVGRARVINPGSVGMPYGEPGAFWAVMGPDIQFRRTDYDRHAAAERLRRSAWPGADEFARDNVVTVPSVEYAMAFFTKVGGP